MIKLPYKIRHKIKINKMQKIIVLNRQKQLHPSNNLQTNKMKIKQQIVAILQIHKLQVKIMYKMNINQ